MKKTRMPKVSTVVGKETEILGDLNFSGGLHVDGCIKGNLTSVADTPSLLMISETGRVEGEVRVANLVLNGTVVGDVYVAQRLELASEARITGTVHYSLLEMAMGAEVNGRLVHSDEAEPKRLGYQREKESVPAPERAPNAVRQSEQTEADRPPPIADE